MHAAIKNFFPTSVYTYEDSAMAEKMLPIVKKYLADPNYISKKQFGTAYKTTYGCGGDLITHKDFNEFKSFILQHVSIFHEAKGYERSKFQLSNIFMSEMFSGNHHAKHNHPNANYACVFYLQIPEGSSPIVFFDPRKKFDLSNDKSKKVNETMFNEETHTIFPKKGLLLIWDAWVEHMVPENKCEDGRITLVCNIQ